MTYTTIEVYCGGDGPRSHTVREIAAYDCDERGKWSIGRRPDRQRQRDRQAEKRRAAGETLDLIPGALLDFTPLRCKLCGEQLAGWREVGAMVPVLDDLVAQRESRVSISRLQVLLSKKR